MKKTRVLTSLVAAFLVLGTAACGSGSPEPDALAAPEGPAGITISEGRLNLPTVEGNPGAVYFTITNASEKQATIRGADMVGAQSGVLHETAEWEGRVDMQELFSVPVLAGESLAFEPGGKHVMVFDLDPSLAVGGETEATLTFAGGDKISFPVKILAAGDEGADDEGAIDHSGHSGG